MQPDQNPITGDRPSGPGVVSTDDDESVGLLVSRAGEGDEEAWRRIVDLYARRVYGLLRSKGCDRERAEEITQSVFVSVARVLGQGRYREQGRFDSWLLRIAMNRLRDDARVRKRRPVRALEEASEPTETLTMSDNGHENQGPLREALADLSPPDREVIELRHRADMSFKQIADLLDQPLGTVLARHHRALRKLRSALEAAGMTGSRAPGA